MNPIDALEDKCRTLLADASGWRALGLLFQRPSPRRLTEMRGLARESGDSEVVAAVETASTAAEGEYLAWLGPGGRVAAREPAYQPIRDPGRLLADLSGFYRAFAYSPDAEDPPDHLATELGFVSFLRLKEAYASKADRGRDADLTARALRRFLDEHLVPFLEAFQPRIAQPEAPLHLRRAARAAVGRVRRLTELVEISGRA